MVYRYPPPGQNHFAETGDEPVLVQITGFGLSPTDYAAMAAIPAGILRQEVVLPSVVPPLALLSPVSFQVSACMQA